MSDLISRADAIEAIASAEPKDTEYHYYKHIAIKILSELPSAVCDDCIWSVCNYNKVGWDTPSAEAEPTVIRSKTLMPTKDFKEWAKRIREENPNAVIIPCDAEVVSADAVRGEWIGYNADKEDWLRTDGTPIFLVCDKCHGTVINNGSAHWNYCPNCGARMKGGDNE